MSLLLATLLRVIVIRVRTRELTHMDEQTAEKEKEMSKLTDKDREKLPESDFAFPKERKEPLVDASHVRDAIARFDQVEGVTDKERDEAWKRIKKAAEKFGVELHEKDWRELFKRNDPRVPKE
jgi:hypothetical protein